MSYWQLVNEAEEHGRRLDREMSAGGGHEDAKRQAVQLSRVGRYKEAAQALIPLLSKLDSDGHEIMSRAARNHVDSVFARHGEGEEISRQEIEDTARIAAHIHGHHVPHRAQQDKEQYKGGRTVSLRHIQNKNGMLVIQHYYPTGDIPSADSLDTPVKTSVNTRFPDRRDHDALIHHHKGPDNRGRVHHYPGDGPASQQSYDTGLLNPEGRK